MNKTYIDLCKQYNKQKDRNKNLITIYLLMDNIYNKLSNSNLNQKDINCLLDIRNKIKELILNN